MIKAGFFETDITPIVGMERPATYYKIYINKINDPLKVRAAVLDNGDERIAIIGIDACVISDNIVAEARQKIHEWCGIKPQNIMLAASHTHSGGLLWPSVPGLEQASALINRLVLEESISPDKLYEKWVIGQIVNAVVMADNHKQEVTISVGRGIEDRVAFNRRFRLKNGRCATHPGKGNPEIIESAGPMDPEVGVIAAWDKEDRLVGCIVNFSCHATCDGTGATADYIGYIAKTIQGVMGTQAQMIFINGACGDITQFDNRSLQEQKLEARWSKIVGTRVGAEAIKVLIGADKGNHFTLRAISEKIRLRHRPPSPASLVKAKAIVEEGLRSGKKDTAFHFSKERLILEHTIKYEPEKEMEIQAIQIGPVVIISNPAELFCAWGLEIKKRSNFPFTFVATLANGICGYVPTEDALDPQTGGGYETVLTCFTSLEIGAGRKIVETSLALAAQLQPEQVPEGKKVAPSNTVWSFGALGPELE